MSELSADELERLAGAATARPWVDELMHDYVIIVQADDSGGPIAEFNGLPGKDCQANAAFIVYLANHAAAVADVVRENERLRNGLQQLDRLYQSLESPQSDYQAGFQRGVETVGIFFREDLLAMEAAREALGETK